MFSIEFQPGSTADIGLIKTKYKNHIAKAHYHLDYHIGLVTSGEQVFNYKGSKHQIGPGFIQVMMPGQVHDGSTVKENEFSARIFSLNTNWLNNLENGKFGNGRIPYVNFSIEDFPLYYRLFNLHEELSKRQNYKLAADCLQIDIFSLLFNRYGDFNYNKSHKVGVKQLDLLRDYLMENLSEKVALSDLANLCELSESQLLRHFKRTVGITPYAWLARLRLEKALLLLQAGEPSTCVSHKVGFYDQAHFIKAFKLAYGISPSKIPTL